MVSRMIVIPVLVGLSAFILYGVLSGTGSNTALSLFGQTVSIGQFAPLVGVASFTLALYKYFSESDKAKKKRQEVIESSIKPAMSPLVTALKSSTIGNFSSEEIDELAADAEKKVRGEGDLLSTIIYMSDRFAGLLKVDEKYHKAYVLALAYRLVLIKDIGEGTLARQINSSVTKRHTIKCGNEFWTLTNEDAEWYVRFSEFEELFAQPFQHVYDNVKGLDAQKLVKERDEIYGEVQGLKNYIKDRDIRFQKLMTLIMHKIPRVDFLKVMVSLRTNIVLISIQGVSDPADRGITTNVETGSKYLNMVFKEKGLRLGRLNRSVYFAFLADIIPLGTDARYFDLQSWGKQIEIRANELRQSEGVLKRRFNFVVLKSSLHELRSFGDDLGEESRIKISPQMLDNLGYRDATLSTLITIAKILRDTESTSLKEFIDRNLEYLMGIGDEMTAKRVSEILMTKYSKEEWLISDFKRYGIKKEDLVSIGLDEERADNLIKESTAIAEMLS